MVRAAIGLLAQALSLTALAFAHANLAIPVLLLVLLITPVVFIAANGDTHRDMAGALITGNVVLMLAACLLVPLGPAWAHDDGFGTGFLVALFLPVSSLVSGIWTLIVVGISAAIRGPGILRRRSAPGTYQGE